MSHMFDKTASFNSPLAFDTTVSCIISDLLNHSLTFLLSLVECCWYVLHVLFCFYFQSTSLVYRHFSEFICFLFLASFIISLFSFRVWLICLLCSVVLLNSISVTQFWYFSKSLLLFLFHSYMFCTSPHFSALACRKHVKHVLLCRCIQSATHIYHISKCQTHSICTTELIVL